MAGLMFFLLALIIGVGAFLFFSQQTGLDSPYDLTHDDVQDTVIFKLSIPEVDKRQLVSYLNTMAGEELSDAGATFYRLGSDYDIDPAFAVAVALKETSLGRSGCGEAPADCKNFFCLRYGLGLSSRRCGSTEWAKFDSTRDAIAAFYAYIDEKYVRKSPSQDTVTKIGCEAGSFDVCYCKMSRKPCEGWVRDVSQSMQDVREHGLI